MVGVAPKVVGASGGMTLSIAANGMQDGTSAWCRYGGYVTVEARSVMMSNVECISETTIIPSLKKTRVCGGSCPCSDR